MLNVAGGSHYRGRGHACLAMGRELHLQDFARAVSDGDYRTDCRSAALDRCHTSTLTEFVQLRLQVCDSRAIKACNGSGGWRARIVASRVQSARGAVALAAGHANSRRTTARAKRRYS